MFPARSWRLVAATQQKLLVGKREKKTSIYSRKKLVYLCLD